jgi:hypothetical protein
MRKKLPQVHIRTGAAAAAGNRSRTRKSEIDRIMSSLATGDLASITPHGILFQGLIYTCDRAFTEDWFIIARMFGSWRVECGHDPALVDFIQLFPKDKNPIEARLSISDTIYAGCSWAELRRQREARRN